MSKYKVGDSVWVKETIEDLDIIDNSYFMGCEKGGWFGEDDILGKTDESSAKLLLEAGRSDCYKAGMREAWKLALELRYMDYSDKLEIFGLKRDERDKWGEIMENYTPQEVKAKIKAWEKAKEEIKVGDVCECRANGNIYRAVCLRIENNKGMFLYDDVSVSGRLENLFDWEKTGRHIDIQSVLEQIGGKE